LFCIQNNQLAGPKKRRCGSPNRIIKFLAQPVDFLQLKLSVDGVAESKAQVRRTE